MWQMHTCAQAVQINAVFTASLWYGHKTTMGGWCHLKYIYIYMVPVLRGGRGNMKRQGCVRFTQGPSLQQARNKQIVEPPRLHTQKLWVYF